MRACISGNRVLALKLYNRNPKALAITNARGENCLNIAKSSGHPDIATVLECLEVFFLFENFSEFFFKFFEKKKNKKSKKNQYFF